MAEVTLDSVNIELSSDSSKASKGIDGLINSIDNLKKSAEGAVNGLSSLSESIKNITKSFSGLSGISSSFKSVNSEMKILKNSANGLSGISFTGNTKDLNDQRQRILENREELERLKSTASDNINVKVNDSGISSVLEKLETMDSSIKNTSKNTNLLLRGLSSGKNSISGMAAVAQKMNVAFNGAGKISRQIAKSLRPLKTILTAAAKSASAMTKGLNLDGTLKKLSKYFLALFSIRGAYAAINTVANHWLDSSNRAAQQLSVNIDYLKYAIGSAVSPIIENLTNLIYSLLKALQSLIYALTGINIFAKAFAKDMKGAAGSASKVKKELSLAPFDELNSLGSTKNSGGGSGGSNLEPTFDLTEVDMTYNKWVEKLIDFFKPLIDSWHKYGGELTSQLKSTASSVTSAMGSVWKSFENIITNGTVYKGLESILRIVQNIAVAFRNAWTFDNNGDKIIQNLANAFNNLLNAIERVTKSDKFQKWLTNVVAKLKDISEKLKSINWQPFIEYMADIGGKIGNAALFILDKFVDLLKWIVEHPKVITIIGGIAAAFISLKTIASIGTSISKITAGLKVFSNIGGTSEIAGAIGETGEIGSVANSAGSKLSLPSWKTLGKGMLELTAIIGYTIILVEAIGEISKIPGVKETATSGIELLKTIFFGIGSIAIPLASMAAGIAVLGGIGFTTIVQGCGGFALVIIAVAGVVSALGALAKNDKFMEIVSLGSEVFVKIANTIGEFAGALVGGALAGISDGLPKIGTNLSNFMINASVFFDNIDKINKDATEGVKNLAETLLILTAVNIIEGLTSWFAGKVDLEGFGKQLEKFGPYLASYSSAVSSVNAQAVVASSIAAKSMIELYTLVPRQGGLAQILLGSKSLAFIGKDLVVFGKLFKQYADNIDGINSKAVTESSNAAKAMLELYNMVPAQFGLAQLFTGSKSLAIFGVDMVIFGGLFKQYANNIKGINSEVVTASANTAKAMLQLYELVPKQGGLAQLFTGSSKLSDFGKDLEKFGNYFNQYYSTISGISTSVINSVTSSINNLVNSLLTIKNGGLTGTLADFGSALTKATKGMTDFFKSEFGKSKAETIGKEFGSALGSKIKSSMKSNLGTTIQIKDGGSTLKTFSLKAYASGGFPSMGEIFIAGEAGPEWVSTMGGQTAVANNDQMTTGIREAAYEGVSRALRENPQSSKTDVYIGNKKVYDGYTEYANRESNKYGTNIIRV